MSFAHVLADGLGTNADETAAAEFVAGDHAPFAPRLVRSLNFVVARPPIVAPGS